MLIGHLPAGFLTFRFLSPSRWPKSARVAGIIGAVFPDIDMLWFHLIDHGAFHHHEYLTHRPAFYAMIFAAVLAFSANKRRLNYTMLAFCLGALLHLMLDSVAGHIAWGWPFSDFAAPLTIVQPTHSHWVWSFMNHWYFRLEIAIALIAIAVILFDRKQAHRG